MKQKTNKTIYSSQVLDRVMQILNCFTNENRELRFADLSAQLGLHKSTLYRLLEAMRSYGLIELDGTTGKYHPGLKLFELGMLAVGRLEISKSAIPALERLVEQTGETAHLCVLDGYEVVYVAKVESKQTLRMPSNVGRRNPAYCTGVGKALLAQMSEEEIEAYLAQTSLQAFTKKTIVLPAELKRQLKEVLARGYSVDDEEISEGLRCVGAAVRDHNGQVIAAISIAGPTMRITKNKMPELAAYVKEAANSMSEQLGYRSMRRLKVVAR